MSCAHGLPPLYSQEAEDEPTVYAKFFLPGTGWTWYVTEGSEEEGDFMFFGFVGGQDSEFGYFLLSELESVGVTLLGISCGARFDLPRRKAHRCCTRAGFLRRSYAAQGMFIPRVRTRDQDLILVLF